MTIDEGIRTGGKRSLRASEEQLRAVFDQAAVGMALRSLDGRWLDVNQKLCDILGYSREELQGLTSADITPAEDRAEAAACNERIRRGELSTYSREMQYLRKDGSAAWVNLTVSAVNGPDGKADHLVSVIEDVGRRKLAEDALRERERQLRLIADNVPTMITYTDAEYRCRYANERFADFYFEKGSSFEGKHIGKLLGAASYAAVRPGIERALAGELVCIDVPRRRRDGQLRQVNVTLTPHRDDRGLVRGVYTFALDVTGSRKAEDELRESETALRLLIDNVPAKIAYLDANRRYGYANRGYRDFYAPSDAPIEGLSIEEVLDEDSMRAAGPQIERAYAGEAVNYQANRRRRDGRIRVVDISLVPHRDEAGRVLGIYILAIDVTRRQRAERILRLRSRAIESSVNSIVITEPTDEGQRITYVNPAFERITGYAASEVLGRSPRFLRGDDNDQPVLDELCAAAREQREATALLRNYRKDGTLFWNELRVAPVRDEAGQVTHFISVSSDVTERIRYESEIERNANYDALTGLPNRNLLSDRLKQAISNVERTKSPAAVLYIDLDQFKRINDSLGHAIGDQVLTSIGARLAAVLRTGDTVARWGGDEFVAVLTNLSHEDDVTRVVEKLRRVIAAPLEIETHVFVLGASIGIALAPKDGSDGPMLLRNADTALYRAKAQGRDCFRFFAAEMNEHAVRYLSMEHGLRGALEAGGLSLQYQPIVQLTTGETVGAEALIRWRQPDGRVISPVEFIPVAEESGLIMAIGRWVFETAADQAAAWNRGRRAPLYVSVNLSARQFRDPGLVDMIRAALDGAKLDPALVKFEITESTVMQNAEVAARTLHRLKDLGVLLSVDDFGTGYSSLGYLKRFPIDTLKIDRSFVRDLPADRDDLAICRAVIDLAQGLELDVVAEGIETSAQAAMISTHGCGFAQGFLFSRPVDPGELEMAVRSQPPVLSATAPRIARRTRH